MISPRNPDPGEVASVHGAQAVLLVDHNITRILPFDLAQWSVQTVAASADHAHQDQRDGRTDHEYFNAVCDAVAGVAVVLVTGPAGALADFRDYVEALHPSLAARVVGWEPVTEPSDAQLVALGRRKALANEALADPTSD
ncbi:MAG: hypothetical protein ABI880_15075 [Acidobacteriota bacterium]